MHSGTEFTNFIKRLQSALKRRNINLTSSEIKSSISDLIFGKELNDDLQATCLNALLEKHQSTSLVQLSEPESVLQPVIPPKETENAIVQSERLARDLVCSKASSMGIVLSEADVVAIANQLDYQVDSSVEDVIAEAEALLIAYADHVKQQSKQKVTAMINRVYSHVGNNNTEVSQHLSEGLQQFASDLGVSQQEFKRQAQQALRRLKISKNSA
ncbi:hypothetical protein F7734_10110 [Scytonema sp. UIC 10036]|uniref:hypothetical protein n=1 Tax=Scytonema sp. UIC 10036 TaxID=2304196 RepID=UPI0012DA9275|nr:hypothetical protein [Scytonema sp. UIC 10036]MUG92785.1 hypothetical protein [Scytonema sp. UIC 10036]